MIEGPADHGLYVTYQLHPFVLKSYMPQPHLPRHRYELFFVLPYRCYNLISPYRLSYQSALALSGAEVLHIACEPNKQFALIVGPQRLLADQHLFRHGQA